MKIQTWTKVAAMLLLTGVLAGCEQGADDDAVVAPVTTPGDVDVVPGDDLDVDADADVTE